jgi:thiopurine S-methyltransferase
MEKAFWEESWERGDIGFHQNDIYHNLQRFYHRLAVAEGDPVFVPLCGKTLDMLWLQQQGASVIGVELSSLAVQAFFDENMLDVVRERDESFERYKNGDLEILCGDLFNLKQDDLAGSCVVYDRASLGALPPEMRRRYSLKLASLLPSGSRVLLVTFDYDQAEMAGPPFAVTTKELEELFAVDFTIEPLIETDALESYQALEKRGLTRLSENVYLLIRK